METNERLKKLAKMLEKLKGNWIFVEGQKDRYALEQLGLTNILTISGNLRLSCRQLVEKRINKVYVLTDLDRRGYQLAMMAKSELEGLSITAELSVRGELGYILGIKNFENAKKAYDKLMKEGEMNG